MIHNDIILFILGFMLPNNMISWIYRRLRRRRYPLRNNEVRKQGLFTRLAIRTGDAFGSPVNFVMWIAIVGIWIWSGHLFHYNNTWQLLINTPTTVIELFAAILIQYVGNRIERRQEEHEEKMLDMLSEVRSLSELLAADLEQPAPAEQEMSFQGTVVDGQIVEVLGGE